jgi:NDP-sugar pyrophosphorylase family protein
MGSAWQDFPEFDDCSLIPFLNRPFIYHVVETLVERGCRVVEFFCDHDISRHRKILGDGERWGVEFHFHESPAPFAEEAGPDLGVRRSVTAHTLPFSSENQTPRQMIRVDSPRAFLESQEAAMKMDFSSRLTIEQCLRDGVWVGRNVSIHPTVTLEGPVLIGDNTHVSAGAHVGPYTVIGADCLIDRNTSVTRSTVLPNVYVGEGLDVIRSIVSSQRILNVHLGTNLPVSDGLVLGRFPW